MGTTISGLDGSINLADYASIKNGSYKKLMKAYYKQEEEEKAAAAGGDSKTKLTSIKATADELKSSAETLQKENLWQKKTFTKTDEEKIRNADFNELSAQSRTGSPLPLVGGREETGEETTYEDYDWEAITNAVKKFTDAYNSMVEGAGNSDTKNVLMNTSWMTKMTASNAKLLAKAGIEIGKDNKLSVDEEALKKKISTTKFVFKGYNSFADKVATKAGGIIDSAARAAADMASAYDKHGAYTSPLTSSAKDQVDSALGKTSKTTANTDKVDKEIKNLKSRRDSLKQKIKSEYDTEKKRQYEKELKQVENELAVKDTDSYRKQNAFFS